MRTEDYIADNIVALCKKRDMSKYRLSQLTGISQSISEECSDRQEFNFSIE